MTYTLFSPTDTALKNQCPLAKIIFFETFLDLGLNRCLSHLTGSNASSFSHSEIHPDRQQRAPRRQPRSSGAAVRGDVPRSQSRRTDCGFVFLALAGALNKRKPKATSLNERAFEAPSIRPKQSFKVNWTTDFPVANSVRQLMNLQVPRVLFRLPAVTS